MSFSKAFKITKDVRTFQAGEYTGFNLTLGAQYYDRKEGKKWTNYKAALFAKANQVQFYTEVLVVGSIVELSSDDLKIDMYNPEYPTIELLNAKMVNVFRGDAPQQQAQQQPQNRQPQQPQQRQVPADYDPNADINW